MEDGTGGHLAGRCTGCYQLAHRDYSGNRAGDCGSGNGGGMQRITWKVVRSELAITLKRWS